MDVREKILASLECQKSHPVKTFLKNFFWKWPVYRFPRKIKDFYYEIKYYFQKRKRGFSDKDFFEADIYITTTLANILEFIAENHSGHPLSMTDEEYTTKLYRIARAFRDYSELEGEENSEFHNLVLENLTDEEFDEKYAEINAKYLKIYDNIYNTMGELFKDGFICNLWD